MVSQEWSPLVTLKLYSQLKDVKECGKFVHDQRYILAGYTTQPFLVHATGRGGRGRGGALHKDTKNGCVADYGIYLRV